jgi:pimeloyl-ACP methyl ester carboxylesterase
MVGRDRQRCDPTLFGWNDMAQFVLVHGAFHGGWCWARLIPLLKKAGHEVWTPTLTGLGERSHLLSPDVGLSTHVRDVVNVLEYEDLQDVILVGHSYGGMVVTGVARTAPERLREVVYLDALVPEDGQAAADILTPEVIGQFRAAAREYGEGWWIPSPSAAGFGVEDPEGIAWADARLTPHPLKTFEETLPTSTAPHHDISRTYVYCLGTQSELFKPFADHAQAAPDWRYFEVDTGHDLMVSKPAELAAILEEVAAAPHPPARSPVALGEGEAS